QYRGQTHDEAVDELKPQAEERLKTTLALRELVRAEGLTADEAEVDAEVARLIETYEEDQRERAQVLLSTQLRPTIASTVIEKKRRDRLLEIATGTAPEPVVPAAVSAEADESAAQEVSAAAEAEE